LDVVQIFLPSSHCLAHLISIVHLSVIVTFSHFNILLQNCSTKWT